MFALLLHPCSNLDACVTHQLGNFTSSPIFSGFFFFQFPGFATLQNRLLLSAFSFFSGEGSKVEGPWCIALRPLRAAGKQNSLLYKYKPTVSSHDRYSIAASLYHLLVFAVAFSSELPITRYAVLCASAPA